MKILRFAHLSFRVQASFFVLALLVAIFLNAGIIESVLVVAILLTVFAVHELGHILMASCFSRPCQTTISCIGGHSEVLGEKLSLWKRFFVTLGGLIATYIVSVGLRLLIEGSQESSELVQGCLFILYQCNTGWLLINLLPLYPFDVGRFMVEAAFDRFGRRVEKGVIAFTALVAFALALYSLYVGLWLSVLIALYSLNKAYIGYKHAQNVNAEFSEEKMFFHHLCQMWTHGNREKVLTSLKHLSEVGLDPDVRKEALSTLSGFLLDVDRPLEAYTMLESSNNELSLSALEHLQLASYKTSHWMEGLEAGKRAFMQEKTLSVASLCALLAARLLRDKEAVEWIIAAQNLGLTSLEKFLQASDFDGIRASSSFSELVAQIEGLQCQ